MNPYAIKTKVTLAASQTLAASGTLTVKVDTLHRNRLIPFFTQTYAAVHATTTGVTCKVIYGIEDPSATLDTDLNAKVRWADNEDPVTSMVMPAAAGGAQTKRSTWNIPVAETPRFAKLVFTNTDVTNAATVELLATG